MAILKNNEKISEGNGKLEEISEKSLIGDDTKNIKIILSGLDNAGKTSMLIGLKKLYRFEDDLRKLKPTIRIDYYKRDFLNLHLTFFDMGGQKKFRDIYLKRPIYFEAVNQLIYLIDIQDDLRFGESIEYLGNVLDILNKNGYNKDHPIYICFSKADFDYLQINFAAFEETKTMIAEWIERTYPNFKFRYYYSSIYNIYTIVQMISDCLKSYIPNIGVIHTLLQNFAGNNDLFNVLLFDHTGLIISDYFSESNAQRSFELKEKINRTISGYLAYFAQLENTEMRILENKSFDNQSFSACYQFQLRPESEPGNKDDLENKKENNLNETFSPDHNPDPNDPLNFNYYLSLTGPIGKMNEISEKIYAFIEEIQDQLIKILKED